MLMFKLLEISNALFAAAIANGLERLKDLC
jgi:hypothetical protein